ncbi:hypothetical protein V1279_002988 [Bradyrhizobium sp. AZCC 1610]|uniref:hypothetical protein n=1 Tax=Bradyrhizobium sp. AZCC 1610 TaxID=3117020 RepID=UPI002FF3A9E9
MKKRAFITMTLAVDLDMVAGPWDKPSDWTDAMQRQFHAAACYHPEFTVHEIIEKVYDYVEGQGWVRPEAVTIADRMLKVEEVMGTFNVNSDVDVIEQRIHQIETIIADSGGPGSIDHMPERNSDDAVDEDGCPTW